MNYSGLQHTVVKADKDYHDATCMIILAGERNMCDSRDIGAIAVGGCSMSILIFN